jgi:SAM-dependent methyltransferase
VEHVPVDRAATVVEVGAGTGKLTRVLAARFARVIAVEPDGRMRALIDAGEPVAGAAEELPLPDGSVDAVFAAESFHWFDEARALAEFERVLRPRGVVCLLWNMDDPGNRLLPDGVLPARRGTPPEDVVRFGGWREALGPPAYEPLREVAVRHGRDVSRDVLLDHYGSMSPITSLPDGEREPALARVAATLDRPVYRQSWTALAYWTRRA